MGERVRIHLAVDHRYIVDRDSVWQVGHEHCHSAA